MNSQLPRVQSCLPGVRGAARVYGPSAELAAGQALALEADTVAIDTDHLRCSVVWRGSFPVAAERDLAALRIFAGVADAADPLTFPSSYAQVASAPGERQHASSTPPPAEETETRDLSPPKPHAGLDPQSTTMAIEIPIVSRPATPFGASSAPPRPLPANLPVATPFEARGQRSAVPPPPPSQPHAGATMTMDLSAHPVGPVLPFHAGPADPAYSQSHTPAGPALDAGQTMDLSALLAGSPLPFHAAAPSPSPLPIAPAGPIFPEVRRPSAPFAAPAPEPAPPEPRAELLLDGAPPKTLGGFFLAAMARSAQATA